MVVTYTLASWARSFCTAAAFKQASGLQQKMAASEQTYGRFRTDMPKTWLKNQNGVSNYRMAYQIIVASRRARTPRRWRKAGATGPSWATGEGPLEGLAGGGCTHSLHGRWPGGRRRGRGAVSLIGCREGCSFMLFFLL